MFSRKAITIALSLAAWASSPLVVTWYYERQLSRGVYPAEGDTIAIPIAYNYIGWALLAPLVLGALFVAVRRAPKEFSLGGWDVSRPWQSWFWTAATGAVVAVAVVNAWRFYAGAHWPDFAHAVLVVCAAVMVRAAAVARREAGELG